MQSLVKVGIDSVKFEYSSRTVGVEFVQRLRRVFVKFARQVVVNKQEIIVQVDNNYVSHRLLSSALMMFFETDKR